MKLKWLRWVEKAGKNARDAVLATWGEATGRRHLALPWRLRGVEGWFSGREAMALYRSVLNAPAGEDVVEIGSWKGRSTVTIALALRELGGQARVYAIDPHRGVPDAAESKAGMNNGSTLPEFTRNLRRARVDDLVETMVMVSSEAVPLLAERGVKARLAFIDGQHAEEAVREDLALVLALLVPDGLVVFHDCSPDSPQTDVWKVWQEDLAGRAEVVARAGTLLVARPI